MCVISSKLISFNKSSSSNNALEHYLKQINNTTHKQYCYFGIDYVKGINLFGR